MYRKAIYLLVFTLYVAQACLAQSSGIGLSFGAYDFYGPQTDNYFVNSKYKYTYNEDTKTYDTSLKNAMFWTPLVKLSYWHSVSKNIDINVALSLANVDYPKHMTDGDYIRRYRYDQEKNEKFLGELDGRFQYNIFSRYEYPVSPYLLSGFTLSYHDEHWGGCIPVGGGVNIALSNNLSLNLESVYKLAGTDFDQDHYQHSAGLIFWVKNKAPKDVVQDPSKTDSDGDGIDDAHDNCPSVAGIKALDGCPDSDGDGLADDEDECPDEAGPISNDGCPRK